MYRFFLPIAQGVHAHRAKSTELLNFDVVWSGSLHCGHQRLSCYLRLALLSHASWMARLCCERLFIGVVLLLSPDVDLVLRASRIYVIQLTVVLHGRTSALGESAHCLLLLRSRDRDDLKARLREQGLFLGDSACTGGLTRCQ